MLPPAGALPKCSVQYILAGRKGRGSDFLLIPPSPCSLQYHLSVTKGLQPSGADFQGAQEAAGGNRQKLPPSPICHTPLDKTSSADRSPSVCGRQCLDPSHHFHISTSLNLLPCQDMQNVLWTISNTINYILSFSN